MSHRPGPTERYRAVGSGCRALVAGCLLFLGLYACDASPAALPDSIDGETPSELLLSASQLWLTTGDTFQLQTAFVWKNPSPAGAGPISWTSSAPHVATVSSSGLVVAQGNGEVTITASSGTLTQSASISVEEDTEAGSDPAGQIIITPSSVELASGDTVRLQAAVIGKNGKLMPSTARINWSSSAPGTATVDGSGLVLGRQPGQASITASTRKVAQHAAVAVKTASSRSPDAPASIVLTPSSIALEAGDTVRIAAQVLGSTGAMLTDASVTWSSTSDQVATIDQTGLLLAVASGEAAVIATAGGASRVAPVEVHEATAPPPPGNEPFSIVLTPDGAELQPQDTVRLSAIVLGASGNPLSPQPVVSWSTSKASVASVDASGLVTAVGTGSATITAAVDEIKQSVVVKVDTEPPPPADEPASIVLNPSSLELAPKDTATLTATVIGKSGAPINGLTIVWSTSNTNVASVNAAGRVTAIGDGSAGVTAAVGSVKNDATVEVSSPPPPPPPPPPPSGSEWDRVLADTSVVGDVVVPDGEAWLIGANVSVRGNVRTHSGTIAMRPGSSLRFVGANPGQYVGGGMHYMPQFANDYGIWIGAGPGATGKLDISCTPKVGWNRTGSDPSWRSDDEYWISPTNVGDHSPRRWFPGQAIPRADPRVPAAEVMNITRDCKIEGPGHIHIHSTVPQRIEYVELRHMGVSKGSTVTTGRYALHLHFMGNGSRGMVVRGVAMVESLGKAFVPHESHGVTFIDNVSVNSFGEGFWWDIGDHSDDILVDRLAVSGVHYPPSISGVTSRINGISLGSGSRMEIRNSAISGVRGSKLSVGFDWPEGAFTRGIPPVWTFDQGNVSHNNTGPGLRFWTNREHNHVVRNYVAYRNTVGGIETGAYGNSLRYFDSLLLDNGIVHHSTSRSHELDGGPARYVRVHTESRNGPALDIGQLRGGGSTLIEWVDCTLSSPSGEPKVRVDPDEPVRSSFHALFRNCGMTPGDIQWGSMSKHPLLEGSRVVIDGPEGNWTITIEGGQVRIQ